MNVVAPELRPTDVLAVSAITHRFSLSLVFIAFTACGLAPSHPASAQPLDDRKSTEDGAPNTRTCTVLYDLDATFQITDTPFGAGDQVFPHLDGMWVLRFQADEKGSIASGPVDMLHFWLFQRFEITGIVTLKTSVHAFSPSCNGVPEPSWRLPTDPDFPSVCSYTGNTNPIATGSFDLRRSEMTWPSCDAAHTYWSEERTGSDSYRPSDRSSGPGCISNLRWIGNMHCSGLCGLGSPDRGDNPVRQQWTQPLVNGPRSNGTTTMAVSGDSRASTITTPNSASGGHQSYNVPNDDRSRTWMSWVATRRDSSAFTTCR